MALTWQGKVVLVGILGFVAYSAMGMGKGNREVERRASLGACGLATEYIEWRTGFEITLGETARIEGQALKAFVSESQLFSRASARTTGNTAGTQQEVLRQLNMLTTHDARRSERNVASSGPFLEAFFSGCAAEAAVLSRRYAR